MLSENTSGKASERLFIMQQSILWCTDRCQIKCKSLQACQTVRIGNTALQLNSKDDVFGNTAEFSDH